MARIVRLICAFGALSMSTAVFAAPLNLPKAIPDFSSLTEVTTTYNAGSGAFSVTDGINQYTDNTGSYPASGTFTLNAVIDNTGTLLSGTLTISGFVLFTTPPPVPPAADLLIVDLTDFGFSGAGPTTVFEFTGDTIGFREAAERGLINRAVPPDQVLPEARALARDLAQKSPVVMKLARDSFMRQNDFEYRRAIENVVETICNIIETDEAQEGLDAFNEKRSPRW